MSRIMTLVIIVALLAACGPRELQPDVPYDCERCEEWNEPINPFRIHGNTWYVGTDGLSSTRVKPSSLPIRIDDRPSVPTYQVLP